MTKEEFLAWAEACASYIEEAAPKMKEFASQVEAHDKQAAALLRKQVGASVELAEHLRSRKD